MHPAKNTGMMHKESTDTGHRQENEPGDNQKLIPRDAGRQTASPGLLAETVRKHRIPLAAHHLPNT